MEPLYKKYENALPVGILPLCNHGGLAVLDIDEREECVVAAWDFGNGYQNIRRHKINMSSSGRSYIRKGSGRYYFDQIQRCRR